jgi:hypothetical protein
MTTLTPLHKGGFLHLTILEIVALIPKAEGKTSSPSMGEAGRR